METVELTCSPDVKLVWHRSGDRFLATSSAQPLEAVEVQELRRKIINSQPREGNLLASLGVTQESFERTRSRFSILLLTLVLNSLNRSMGLPDLYPFVLSSSAGAKLSFVHRLVRSGMGLPR